MKKIALLSAVLMSLSVAHWAQASTTGTFAGTFGIVRIMPRDSAGNTDLDAVNLYRAMNVPVKDSMLGPGKAIQDTKKALQFICAIRNGSGYECAIFFQKSDVSTVNPARSYMQYKVTGPAADEFTKLFVTDYKGEYSFVSQEGNFKVEVKPQYFEVLFNKNTSTPEVLKSSTVMIVDVEDTLKITHSQNFWDSLNYVEDTKSRFLGMQEVLSLFASQNDVSFVYLVQPDILLSGKKQREFLTENKFPLGQHLSFQNSDSLDVRAAVLKSVVKERGATQVILMGHNGGIDPDLFSRISNDIPQVKVFTYLHMIYSNNSPYKVFESLMQVQTSGYVTSVELLLDLRENKLIEAGATELAQSLSKRVVDMKAQESSFEKAIPSFVDCQDFYWKWTLEPEMSFVGPVKELLSTRCH